VLVVQVDVVGAEAGQGVLQLLADDCRR
jgi:hypothetical protein